MLLVELEWSCMERYCHVCSSLFILTARRKKFISRNTISFGLHSIISEAYGMALDGDNTELKAKAHKICSIGVFLLFTKNFAVQQVERAGTWACQTSFMSCYLWAVTHRSVIIFFIGPFVAAQQVL